ncbi:MAG: hypothetical protein ACRCUY_10260 [Thermoguttaceae bacterium]
MIYCAIPLLIVFSLCYAATRHEDMNRIVPHAIRFGGWLAFFLILALMLMEVFYRVMHT